MKVLRRLLLKEHQCVTAVIGGKRDRRAVVPYSSLTVVSGDKLKD